MIEVKDLCFDYPGKRALDHVSFTITPNTITALVGPNGAGKTTLLRCLAALDRPLHGSIKIDGWETDRFSRQIHEVCSYLSDFYGLYDELTVTQNLTFFAWSHHCEDNIDKQVKETAKRLDIWEYRDVAAGKLSRGLRQRLAIAQTLIHRPKILLLDEPSAGLDPEARFHLSQMLIQLQKEGMTIIVSSHILSELEDYSSHMIVLDEGLLVKQCGLTDHQSTNNKITLKVEFSEDVALHMPVIQSLSDVNVKSYEKQTVILELQGNQQSQQQLLKTLIEKQLPIISVQEQKQRMQDVYLDITKQKAKAKAKE
ncbi:MAG: ABC transporter ATP-binding protein [Proteobacteria bacterium]|nr:ABC transporter ATP-binding protein [Pseudomonadota bacterium]